MNSTIEGNRFLIIEHCVFSDHYIRKKYLICIYFNVNPIVTADVLSTKKHVGIHIVGPFSVNSIFS